MTDLWGEIAAAPVRTPLAILREQAALLGKKTQNLIEAKVATAVRGPKFVHRFQLVVPSMTDYTYELFEVSHGIEMYPVTVPVTVPSNPSAEELMAGMLSDTVANEEEFVAWLRQELSSEKTMRIVSNLLAQVNS